MKNLLVVKTSLLFLLLMQSCCGSLCYAQSPMIFLDTIFDVKRTLSASDLKEEHYPVFLKQTNTGIYSGFISDIPGDSLQLLSVQFQSKDEDLSDILTLLVEAWPYGNENDAVSSELVSNQDLILAVSYPIDRGLTTEAGSVLIAPTEGATMSLTNNGSALISIRNDGSINWVTELGIPSDVGGESSFGHTILSTNENSVTAIIESLGNQIVYAGDTLISKQPPTQFRQHYLFSYWLLQINLTNGTLSKYENLYSERYQPIHRMSNFQSYATDSSTKSLYWSIYLPGNRLSFNDEELFFRPGANLMQVVLKTEVDLSTSVIQVFDVENTDSWYVGTYGARNRGLVKNGQFIFPFSTASRWYSSDDGFTFSYFTHCPPIIESCTKDHEFHTGLMSLDTESGLVEWFMPPSKISLYNLSLGQQLIPEEDGFIYKSWYPDFLEDDLPPDFPDLIDGTGDTIELGSLDAFAVHSHLIKFDYNGKFISDCLAPTRLSCLSPTECGYKFLTSIQPARTVDFGPPEFIAPYENQLSLSYDTLNFSMDSLYILYGDLLTCEHVPDTPRILSDTVCVGDNLQAEFGDRSPCISQRWQPSEFIRDDLAERPQLIDFNSNGSAQTQRLVLENTYKGLRVNSTERTLTLRPSPLQNISVQPAPCSPDSLGTLWLNSPYSAAVLDFRVNGTPTPYTSELQRQPGLYALSLADTFGCIADTSVLVDWTQPPSIQLFATPEQVLPSQVVLLSAQPDTLAAFQWLSQGLSTSVYNIEGATAQARFSTPGKYAVQLVGEDTLGCIDTAIVEIEVAERGLQLPTALSPNGDVLNDKVIFAPEQARRLELKIYNRWGAQVFSDAGAFVSWEGHNAANEPVPEGVYVYELNVIWTDGHVSNYTRSLTVLR